MTYTYVQGVSDTRGKADSAFSEHDEYHEEFTDDKPKVLVLYTGGTLGMLPDKETRALKPSDEFLREKLKNLVKNKEEDGFPHFVLYQFEELIDSSDMGPSDWAYIAHMIESSYYKYDGFVVVMGTDTMAYAASALSFMLLNLGKPVVFTGSMIPMYKGDSDAHRNLVISIDIAGTKLVVHEKLILAPPKRPFKVLTNLDSNVLVIRLIPGFRDDTLALMVRQSVKLRALVLDLYGVGNAPGRKSGLLDILKEAIENDIIVAVTSQCIHGSVDLKAYAVGRTLYDLGAISTYDMTVESISTKLAFLLGQGLTNDQVKEKMLGSIRGELSLSPDDLLSLAKL